MHLYIKHTVVGGGSFLCILEMHFFIYVYLKIRIPLIVSSRTHEILKDVVLLFKKLFLK